MTQTQDNHSQDQNQNRKSEVVPAVEVDLTGRHLIEASAGTGKTWTLTGIVLRLLIEARRAPEQIIATTFTRAAAAEMRQRIHDRLVDFYQLLQWLEGLSANPVNKDILYPQVLQVIPESDSDDNDDDQNNDTHELNQDLDYESQIKDEEKVAAKQNRDKWLIDQAKSVGLDSIIQDPINLHLISYLLDHTVTYSLIEAIRRTALVLTTLDKLFVGTLDSLAQKWLSEYSSETGHQQGMAIIEDASIEQVTDAIIHDELRKFQSRLYHQQPKLYELMEQKGKLTAVEDHKKYVSRSLNFISAPIDEVGLEGSFDFEEYETLLDEFAELDLVDIQPYLNPDYRKSQGFNGRSSLFTRFESIVEIHAKIAEHKIAFSSYLSEDANKLLQSLKDARYANEDGKIKNFNKNKEKQHQVFYNLPTIDRLMVILDKYDGLEQHIISVLANLNRDIVLTVREQLPITLEERGETTFSLQMVRLNQALTGRQGEKLARYIRHHYPVALIDESQDINGEQAIMIESIYLPTKPSKQSKSQTQSKSKSNNEFLLLVGDPKQAIYGFRGGDVANYNYMKSQFDKSSIWSLDVNRRSNSNLIDALNHWFGMPTKDSDNNKLSQLGEGIYYQHITAHNETSELSWFDTQIDSNSPLINDVLSSKPVSLIHLPKDNDLNFDEHETTARHIAALLNSGQTLKGKPIKPSDIGVLARAKKDLKRVEDELIKLNVPTLTTSDVSIFETIMAEDVAALLSAMLYPYRHDMINRVLTSHLYGLSIKEVQAMMTDHESGVSEQYESIATDLDQPKHKSYQDFISYLKEGAQRWQNFGVLSALHFLLDEGPVQPKGVWQALATHPEGDRHIMDLRHVMDVLAQYGIGMGEHELLAWFRQNIEAAPNSDWAKQHPLPTDSGVQLMTIHKSKGLEFPIVYVLGMGDASRKSGNKEQYGLYLYNAQQAASNLLKQATANQRRFSPTKGSATNESYYTDIETQEDFDELRRLGYVAFTRASEQLYVVLHDPRDKRGMDLKPVFYWFDSQEASFELPDRLKNNIGMLRGPTITEYYENNHNKQQLQLDAATDSLKPKTEPIKYQAFDKVIKQKYFYGWSKTSFTALARQLDESTQALAVADERIDDATNIDVSTMGDGSLSVSSMDNTGWVNGTEVNEFTDLKTEDAANAKGADDIRFNFVKGANAGTFLHEVFEKIDFSNKQQWSGTIDRAIKKYQLPLAYASVEQQLRDLGHDSPEEDVLTNDSVNSKTAINKSKDDEAQNNEDQAIKKIIDNDGLQHKALQGWIEEVLHTPLLASDQQLVNIAPDKRSAELSFNMGLSESFQAQRISEVFEQYLADEPDKHINLMDQNRNSLYRYLRGEIDLVYEHAGKFYVVDYKSNHLGNSLSSYSQQTLKHTMSKAGYWLQAAIYQVALHRFLSIRIEDYVGNEHKYLGPVEYVFLRGVYAAQSDSERYGLVTWDIPIDLVKALDQLFGRPQY